MKFLMNLKDFSYSTPQFALIKHSPFKYSIFQRQELENLELKWMSQYLQQAIHTDFADGEKNISMKNVIKRCKSLEQYLLIKFSNTLTYY